LRISERAVRLHRAPTSRKNTASTMLRGGQASHKS
jgi:hypothetical protein